MNDEVKKIKLTKEEKKRAKAILKPYDLNFRTYTRLALGELILKNGIPFDITTINMSDEVKKTMQKAEDSLRVDHDVN